MPPAREFPLSACLASYNSISPLLVLSLRVLVFLIVLSGKDLRLSRRKAFFHETSAPLKDLFIGTRVAIANSSNLKKFYLKEVSIMLSWSMTFLVIGLIAGILGFSGIAGAATQIAWILFVVFLVLFVVSLIMGRSRAPL